MMRIKISDKHKRNVLNIYIFLWNIKKKNLYHIKWDKNYSTISNMQINIKYEFKFPTCICTRTTKNYLQYQTLNEI